MVSFQVFLHVGGKKYEVLYSDLFMGRETDPLNRPASPVQGGSFTIDLNMPPGEDATLFEWMFSPTKILTGKLVLKRSDFDTTLKTIKFYNAYCVGMGIHFDGTTSTSSFRLSLRVSPEQIEIGGVFHDNNWPEQTPIYAMPDLVETPPPRAKSEALHTLLDVVGMIPVVGELADGANALLYAAEGDYANAALSAAAMVPLAGNAIGAAKLARRGAALAQKAKKLIPPKLIKQLDKVASAGKDLCTKVGHPIDVATGLLFTEAVDFGLPGPIPFVWERTWYSASDYDGPLGYGWHHTYDLGLALDLETDTAVLRMADGRQVAFGPPASPGQSVLDLTSGLSLQRPAKTAAMADAPEPWLVWDKKQVVWYVFAPPSSNGKYQPLHTIENQSGDYIGFRYGINQRLEQITDSAGRLLTVDYNERGQLTGFYGPNPDDADANARQQLIGYVYDEANNLIAVTDAEDHQTTFAYAGHQLVQETNALGFSFYFAYEPINQSGDLPARCIHTWGDAGVIDTKLEYLNPHTTLVRDSYDQPTRYVHKNGVVIEQTDPLGNIQRWLYNEANQLLAQTDELNQTTRFDYDKAGNLLRTRYADGTSQQTSYNNADQPLTFINERGSVWRYAYDEQGLLIRQTDPLGAVTAYTYNEQGQLTASTNALKQTTNLRYDEHGNVAHIVSPGQESSDEQIRSRTYDALGRLIKLTDPTGAVQTRQYDRLGQLVRITESDGSEQLLVYDAVGNVVNVQRGEQVATFRYNGQSRLSERQQAGQQIGFTYDLEGRLTGLTNEAGLPYRFGLNAAGQVIEEEGFDGLVRRYERDAAGRVTRVLRPASRSTRYDYTVKGQVSAIQYSDGTQEVFSYDKSGVLIEARNPTATVRLERDALGRVMREEQNEAWVAYEYDLLGQRTGIRSSLGADIALAHDAEGNLTRLSSQSWQAQFGYDQRGLEVQRQLSGGVQLSWQRDTQGRPTQQRITAGGQQTRQRSYTWTGTDALTQIDDSQTGISQYEYNLLGALTKARYADGSEEFRLPDEVGNLFESATRSDRQYGPGGQLLSSTHGTYQYDAEGNLTQKTTRSGAVWHYEWGGNGMLNRVVRPDGADVTFTYDALGRRLSKTYKSRTTRWVWEGNKPLHEWAELNLDGTNTDEVITWLFEENSFAPVAKMQGTSRQSILADHLGTPLAMVDQGGQTQWSAQTSSYGRIRMEEGTRADCPFRFQGQYEDVETGLYYNRFRYYAPEEGGYISQDPIRLGGGTSLYSYVPDTNAWVDALGLVGVDWVDPGTLNFSQGYVTGQVNDYEELMREGKWDWNRSPLQVAEVNGKMVSLDNRRLLAAQRAGVVSVPIQKVDLDAARPDGGTYGSNLRKKLNSRPKNRPDLPKIKLPAQGTPNQPQVICK